MTARSPWSCILWDVDGTVIDASEGILRRLTATLESLGLQPPTREALAHWIGPPMLESFQTQAGLTPEAAADAVARYRTLAKGEGYETGAELYPGVLEIITALHDAGVPQATASSKPEVQVLALFDYFELDPYFAVIAGGRGGSEDKATVIGDALTRLAAAGVDISRPVLIGDRHHDIDGAAQHGVPVIFVDWGFSWPHESEGAAAVVDTAAELADLVLVEQP